MAYERTRWDNELNKYLKLYFTDNLTDFNDATCHTYFIGTDDCNFKIGSAELNGYLADGNIAYYVKLQISCKAPIVCMLFCKYEKSRTAFYISEEPYTASQEFVHQQIIQFADKYQLEIMKYSDLNQQQTKDGESMYHCYFEQEV